MKTVMGNKLWYKKPVDFLQGHLGKLFFDLLVNKNRLSAHLTCQKNEVMVGMCASGRRKDCFDGKASHGAYCCQYEVKKKAMKTGEFGTKWCATVKTEGSGGNCGWRYGKYGENVYCQNGQVAKGMCASGMYRDCQIKSDRQYPGRDPYWYAGNWYNYNAIYCCDI